MYDLAGKCRMSIVVSDSPRVATVQMGSTSVIGCYRCLFARDVRGYARIGILMGSPSLIGSRARMASEYSRAAVT